MKKVLALVLALMLVCTALVIIPAAESTNPEFTFEWTATDPVLDGEVEAGEYGKYPVDSWAFADGAGDNTFELVNYLITDDEDLEIDFYATWTMDYLYLAWEVNTKYDYRIPFEQTDNYMYNYCYLQLIMTPGAPDDSNAGVYQTGEWEGNYLDLGFCLKEDGESYKCSWTQPSAAGGALTLDDFEFVGSREGDVTTYEVRIAWNKTGVESIGDNAQFGLNWGLGVQEYYDTTQGIVEWTDGAVGVKQADSACIITLDGSGEGQTSVNIEVPDSRDSADSAELPEGMEESPLQIVQLEAAVAAEKISLVTDVENINNYNPKYAHTLLLRPEEDNSEVLEGYYTVVEGVTGTGGQIEFTSDVEDGDIALIIHTDGSEGAAGQAASAAAKALNAGDQVYLHGVQWYEGKAAWLYSNAQLVTFATEDPGETSETESSEAEESSVVEESSEVEESSVAEETSAEESTGSTAATSSAPATSSDASDDEGGISPVVIVVIIVVVVAVVAVVVVLVLKKKKQ